MRIFFIQQASLMHLPDSLMSQALCPHSDLMPFPPLTEGGTEAQGRKAAIQVSTVSLQSVHSISFRSLQLQAVKSNDLEGSSMFCHYYE